MTRTLVAVALITLVAAACAARAPRAAGAPAAPGSTPMLHTLVPRPVTFEPGTGDPFQITPTTAIHVPAGNDDLLRLGRFLADWIGSCGRAGAAAGRFQRVAPTARRHRPAARSDR